MGKSEVGGINMDTQEAEDRARTIADRMEGKQDEAVGSADAPDREKESTERTVEDGDTTTKVETTREVDRTGGDDDSESDSDN